MKATKKALKYLKKAAREKYFGMNLSGVEEKHELFNKPGTNCAIIKGVEENLAAKFHRKLQSIKKKTSEGLKSEEIKRLSAELDDEPKMVRVKPKDDLDHKHDENYDSAEHKEESEQELLLSTN